MSAQLSPLVSTEWLENNLHNPDVQIIDVRWKFREENGKGVAFDNRADYETAHIPGAVYVGMVNDLSDKSHDVPDMMVGASDFARVMSNLGIRNDAHIIVYDDSGLPLAAARMWWALSLFGHQMVQVLDGGLLQWQLEQRSLSDQEPEISCSDYQATHNPEWVAIKSQVASAIDDAGCDIVDCLPEELFSGAGTHTWGARGGHIPGAINIPAVANLDPAFAKSTMAERAELMKERGSYLLGDVAQLSQHYAAKGLSKDRAVIAYCGRGIAASCGLLAMRHLGFENSKLYDGSWAEWSADETLPVEP